MPRPRNRRDREREEEAAQSREGHTPALANRRVGMWRWALSAEEALTAATTAEALKAGDLIDPKVALRYGRMQEKQRKLEAYAPPNPGSRTAASRVKRSEDAATRGR